MYNPKVLLELLKENIEKGNRTKAYTYATILDKQLSNSFYYRGLIFNYLELEEIKECKYLVNMRTSTSFGYKPVLSTNRKERVIKYISNLYNECEELRFRVDEENSNTFINSISDLDYFKNRKVLERKVGV